MKYIKLGWPEIQAYMDNEDYPTDCYYDPQKDAWFIPESWVNEIENNWGDIGDLDDAMG